MPSSPFAVQRDITAAPMMQEREYSGTNIHLCEMPDSIRQRQVRDEQSDHSPVQADQVQKWNWPRINILRLVAACWGFMIMGANDAAIGVC
jgi:hypothetical protein